MLAPRWRKVLGDLIGNKTRTAATLAPPNDPVTATAGV